MHRNDARSMLPTLLLTASAVVVGLLHPGLSTAASPKVDVCHQEGNGSFQLITVAYQAVQAHLGHGDALPGEPVPGNPGARFDPTCAQVAASQCPCDFSLAGLAAVGIDGSADEQLGCYEGNARIGDQRTILYTSPEIGLVASTSTGESFCRVEIALIQLISRRVEIVFPRLSPPIVEVTDLTPSQVTACATDLREAAEALGADPLCPY